MRTNHPEPQRHLPLSPLRRWCADDAPGDEVIRQNSHCECMCFSPLRSQLSEANQLVGISAREQVTNHILLVTAKARMPQLSGLHVNPSTSTPMMACHEDYRKNVSLLAANRDHLFHGHRGCKISESSSSERVLNRKQVVET